jgi:hypothetical protein
MSGAGYRTVERLKKLILYAEQLESIGRLGRES